jgi:AmiR/NasT family two-component response regulator
MQMTNIEVPRSPSDSSAYAFRGLSDGPSIDRASTETSSASFTTRAEYEAKIANLETALRTNRRIGIAIGIVMSQHRCTDLEAFETLRQLSQHRNRKLRELAEEVIYTGALPA